MCCCFQSTSLSVCWCTLCLSHVVMSLQTVLSPSFNHQPVVLSLLLVGASLFLQFGLWISVSVSNCCEFSPIRALTDRASVTLTPAADWQHYSSHWLSALTSLMRLDLDLKVWGCDGCRSDEHRHQQRLSESGDEGRTTLWPHLDFNRWELWQVTWHTSDEQTTTSACGWEQWQTEWRRF